MIEEALREPAEAHMRSSWPERRANCRTISIDGSVAR